MTAAERRDPPHRPAPIRRVLFALVPVTALLLLFEGLARIVPLPTAEGPDATAFSEALDVGGGAATVYDPVYAWRLRPGHTHREVLQEQWARRWGDDRPPEPDRFSPHGFRDTPLATPRPPAQRRVLVLGDSSVFGSGVQPSERFSEVLQRTLAPDGGGADETTRGVEVINTGVPGWSSYQSLQQLRDALHLGLDAVVIYNLNSDLMPVRGGLADPAYFPIQWRLNRVGVLDRLASLRWLRAWRASRTDTQPAEGSRPAAGRQTVRVPRRHYRDNLAEMVALAESQGIRGVFVVPAIELHLEGKVPPTAEALREMRDASLPTREGLIAEMATVASESGWPLVDGPTLFRSRRDAAPDRYRDERALFVDGLHPAPAGHALLAEAILPHLEATLDATPTWAARSDTVPRHAPPTWLGEPLPAEAPATGDEPKRPGPATEEGPQEVSCHGGKVDAEHTLLEVTVTGATQESEYIVTLLRPELARDTEWRFAHCRGERASLLVPAGERVRVTAFIDRRNDGPSTDDPITSLGAAVDLRAGDRVRATLDLAAGLPVADIGAPFGLYHAVYPVLAQLRSDRWADERWRRHPAVIGLVAPLDGDVDATALAAIQEIDEVTEKESLPGRLNDTLDRPAVPLDRYDGLLVVDRLGGDLIDRARAAHRGFVVADSWTDRDGLQWTLLAQETPLPGAFADRGDLGELLGPGEGRGRARAGTQPVWPLGM